MTGRLLRLSAVTLIACWACDALAPNEDVSPPYVRGAGSGTPNRPRGCLRAGVYTRGPNRSLQPGGDAHHDRDRDPGGALHAPDGGHVPAGQLVGSHHLSRARLLLRLPQPSLTFDLARDMH